MCEALFYLKNLKFICLEIFLSLFMGSSVKTTVVLNIFLVHFLEHLTTAFILHLRLYPWFPWFFFATFSISLQVLLSDEISSDVIHLQIYASQGGATLAVTATSQVKHALHGWPLYQTVPPWARVWWRSITKQKMFTSSTAITAKNPGLDSMIGAWKDHSSGPTKN